MMLVTAAATVAAAAAGDDAEGEDEKEVEVVTEDDVGGPEKTARCHHAFALGLPAALRPYPYVAGSKAWQVPTPLLPQ